MPLRLAVLSTSRIVAEFLTHAPAWPELALTALCCRPESAEKGRALAEKAGIPRLYTSEEALYAAGGFDAVYIGTANHLHAAAARRALAAGYHVILEKPFTPTAAEARALFALADEKGVVLFEAITTPYLPTYRFLQAERPKIGAVRGALANFSARSARYDDYLRGVWNTTFDPACFGGALYDMNVYNLHFFCGLLGAPQRAEYRPTLGGNGIDTAGTVLLQYPGFCAAALAAKDSGAPQFAMLQGVGGCLVLQGGSNGVEQVYSVVNGVRTDGPKLARHRMAYEFAEFARIVAEHDTAAEAAARRRSLAVMDLLEPLRPY